MTWTSANSKSADQSVHSHCPVFAPLPFSFWTVGLF